MAALSIAFGLMVAALLALGGICWRQHRVIRRLRLRNSELWIDWRTGITLERFQERRIRYLSAEVERLTRAHASERETVEELVSDLLAGDIRENALEERCHALLTEVEDLRAQVSRGAA